MTFLIAQEHVSQAAAAAAEKFNAGEVIIGHVSNSSHEDALLHLPTVLGIDLSITKHVFMLWFVATVTFLLITGLVRRYVRQARPVPSAPMTALEMVFDFVRDGVATPNVGQKWTRTWTPFLATMFVFVLGANAVGLFPIFDVLGLVDHYVLHTGDHSFVRRLIHGGPTATGNYNVTAGLAVVTFVAIIVAGTWAHGFVKHWKNLVPHGLPAPLYVLLIPMEILGMFVRPFALTMRLAANMTGGHIALLAIMSLVFVFTEMVGNSLAGVGVGLVFSVPLSVGILALEIIVVLVQAYVFTLLSAVFIGMAIHAHH
jgi:F-type H+-transporting ATPase subunit a